MDNLLKEYLKESKSEFEALDNVDNKYFNSFIDIFINKLKEV